MEIFSTCEYVIEELLNYSFVLDKNGNPTKTPKDGKDHGITALEFVVVELPHNLKEINMSAYIKPGVKFEHDKLNEPKPKPKPLYNPMEVDKEDVSSKYSPIYGNFDPVDHYFSTVTPHSDDEGGDSSSSSSEERGSLGFSLGD
jgi:hypothetical protein